MQTFLCFWIFKSFLWLWERVHRFLSDSKRRKCLQKVNQYLRETWRFYFCSFSHPLRLSYSHNLYFMGNVAWYLWRPRRTVLSDNISKFRNTRSCNEFEWECNLNLLPWFFFFPIKEQRPGHKQVRIKLQREDDRYRLIAKIQWSSGNRWLLEVNAEWQMDASSGFFFLSHKQASN